MTTFGKTVTLEEVLDLAEQYRNWGTWGADDEVGSLNYVSSKMIVGAASLVRKGRIFSLAIPMDQNGPLVNIEPRINLSHVMFRDGGDIELAHRQGHRDFMSTDDAVYMPLQCATQWDALAHGFFDGRMYNDKGPELVTSSGALTNAMPATRERMVGRGVLLDVPRLTDRRWLEPGEAIEAEDLEQCCEAQGVEVGEGDFVLIRTGRFAAVEERGSWGDEYSGGSAPGLGVSAADFFCSRRVAAVAADTFASEVLPSQTAAAGLRAPLHVLLIVTAGIHIGEMWVLEALAEDCADDGVYEFLLVAPPLTITGSVGSPVNPQAIK